MPDTDCKKTLKNKRANTMADKTSLGIVGFILAGVTASVVIVAGWVVNDHLTGRLVLDPPQSVAEMSATRMR